MIFFISLGVFVSLFLFRPFNISLLETTDQYYLMIGLSFITFLILSVNLLFLPSFLPRHFSNLKWNIQKEILWNIWLLFTISSGYYLYCKALGTLEFEFNIVVTLQLAAVFPIAAVIIINRNRIIRSRLKTSDELNKKLKENKLIQEKIVVFDSDYQKDKLSLKVSILLFVRSANNYIEVFWKEGDSFKSQMVRCSLTKAEEALKEYKFIFKCHRSYILNKNFVEKVEGNSQGYKVFLENINFPIPVSKNFVQKLNEIL